MGEEEESSNEESATVLTSDGGSAPIDFSLSERLGRRLDRSARFRTTEFRPEYAPGSLVVEYDLGYFPGEVERASLRIRWFENDDFNLHYSEQYDSGEQWECRWDRHPNAHNTRDHFHPTLDASAPNEARLVVRESFALSSSRKALRAFRTTSLGSPPPDAKTPGEDESYPTDWRDVIATVLRELDAHVKGLWE